MTTVRFQVDGDEILVDGNSGQDLMRLALDAGVNRIIGECGGEMSCGTCHVHVRSPWKGAIVSASSDETDLVEMIDGADPDSRLACQIKCRDELEEIVVEVA